MSFINKKHRPFIHSFIHSFISSPVLPSNFPELICLNLIIVPIFCSLYMHFLILIFVLLFTFFASVSAILWYVLSLSVASGSESSVLLEDKEIWSCNFCHGLTLSAAVAVDAG